MSKSAFQDLLYCLSKGETLSAEQAIEAFEIMMSGKATSAQMGSLLSFITARSPTVDEITGAALVMRRKAHVIETPKGYTIIDTCGTGGDASGTFNISTAAALVAAGAGKDFNVAVAKHGNSAVTSASGSSQVLKELGVKLDVDFETLTKCLEEANICFCYAPAHHPAMKYAGHVRHELGFRTMFNLLGPLTNPAGAKRQLMGIYTPQLTFSIANVLQHLGSKQAMVVNGQLKTEEGRFIRCDEISTSGKTQISHLKNGHIETDQFDPKNLGITPAPVETIKADSPKHSAEIILDILCGNNKPALDITCINAAAALIVADVANDFKHGIELARQAIHSGKAKAALDTLIKITQK